MIQVFSCGSPCTHTTGEGLNACILDFVVHQKSGCYLSISVAGVAQYNVLLVRTVFIYNSLYVSCCCCLVICVDVSIHIGGNRTGYMSILVIRSLTSIQNYIGIILCSCFYCSDIRIVVVIQFITGCSPSNHSAVLGFLSLISAQSYDIVVVYVACTKVGRCLLSVSVAGVANQCILFVCTLIGYDILDGLVHIGALNVYRCADCSCNVSIIVIVLCSYVQDDIVCSSLLQILCRDVIISLYRIGYCNLGSFCRNTLRNKVLAGQTALVGNNAGPAAVCAGEAA